MTLQELNDISERWHKSYDGGHESMANCAENIVPDLIDAVEDYIERFGGQG
jgi:hypothetical protein